MSDILIVEDEPDIVELLAYNLHQAGFETTAAFNGEEALRHVYTQPLTSFSWTCYFPVWTVWKFVEC